MRRLITLCVALIACLALWGCSDDGDAPDLTEGLTPTEILERSGDAARDLTSWRIAFQGTTEVLLSDQGAENLGIPPGLLNGPLEFSGAGSVVQPSRFLVDVTAGRDGLEFQANVTRIDGALYLGLFGRDFVVDVPPEQLQVLDSRTLFPSILGWVRNPRNAGEQEVNGAPTVRIEGVVDGEAISEDLLTVLASAPALAGDVAPTPAEVRRSARRLQQQLDDSVIVVWVRTEDLLPTRVTVTLGVPDGSAISPEVRSVRLDLTLDVSDYNADLDIQAPPNPEPLDLNELAGALG